MCIWPNFRTFQATCTCFCTVPICCRSTNTTERWQKQHWNGQMQKYRVVVDRYSRQHAADDIHTSWSVNEWPVKASHRFSFNCGLVLSPGWSAAAPGSWHGNAITAPHASYSYSRDIPSTIMLSVSCPSVCPSYGCVKLLACCRTILQKLQLRNSRFLRPDAVLK